MCKFEDIRDYIQAHPITEGGKVGAMHVALGLVSGGLYVTVFSLPSAPRAIMNKRFCDCTLEECIAWYKSLFNVENNCI